LTFLAVQVSDALLRLQKPASGEVPHAGYLTDISELVLDGSCYALIARTVPYAPTSPFMGSLKQQPKIIGPASTLKLVAKTSAINPLPESDPGAIPEGQHWVDLTEDGAIVVIEQPDGQSCAALGGILALRMKTKGAKGCVVGGRVRDLEELKSCGLPVSSLETFLTGSMFVHTSTMSLDFLEELAGPFTTVSCQLACPPSPASSEHPLQDSSLQLLLLRRSLPSLCSPDQQHQHAESGLEQCHLDQLLHFHMILYQIK
jgi:Aldolase/RraA